MADLQTTTSSSTPWGLLQPYIGQYLTGLTTNLANNPPSPYGGPTVAPLSQNQTTAMDMSRSLAMNGTPTYNASTQAIGTMAAGGAVNPYASMSNPALQQMVQLSNQDIADAFKYGTAPQMSAAAARQGTYGGSGYNQAMSLAQGQLGRSLASNTAGLLNSGYNLAASLTDQDLNRQLQAAGMGVGTQASDLAAIDNLFKMGSAQQGQTQSVLDAAKQYATGVQSAPYAGLDILGNGIGRFMGNGTTTSTISQPGSSAWTNILGGLLTLGGAAFG